MKDSSQAERFTPSHGSPPCEGGEELVQSSKGSSSMPRVSTRGTGFTIVVARTQTALADHAAVACSWRERLVGLLGARELPAGEALIFPRCSSIHTVGMRFPIDAVFVTRGWQVVALRAALPPGRLLLPIWRAWGVIELPEGNIKRTALRVGDQLLVSVSGAATG